MSDRIRGLTAISASGCWEWRGKVNRGGYGRICVSRAAGDQQVHRIAYETFIGPIPDGMEIDHKCRNRKCCNPDHLEAVTPRENQRRSTSPIAKNMATTHCKGGHALAGDNLYLHRGRRQCRECQRARVRAYRRKKRGTA
jgi:HNH endonuclease